MSHVDAATAPHTIEPVPGGVTATPGIRAAGVAAGLKPSGKPDVALVAADAPVAAAAVQTRNQVYAAPVAVTRRHVADGRAQAVLLNAGSANACTGEEGLRTAEESAAAVAAALGCASSDVLVCSTGVIGVPIPREPFLTSIPRAVAALRDDVAAGDAAAGAILTTDTVAKQAAVRVSDTRGSCVVGGMAKGAGMLAPELATMLCVVTTDAPLSGAALQHSLQQACDRTFGRISVDGCMSTNDAVIVLATGTAAQAPSQEAVSAGLEAVCGRLAEAMVRDGEGATRLIRLRVTGAASEPDALGLARAVADSVLVRTAMAGGDPNWGRILAAMGASPVRFDPARVAVRVGDVTVCRGGVVAPFDPARAAAALAPGDVDVTVDVGAGDAEATMLFSDLTHGYVTINAEYTT